MTQIFEKPAKAVQSWDEIEVGMTVYRAYGLGTSSHYSAMVIETLPMPYADLHKAMGEEPTTWDMPGKWFVASNTLYGRRESCSCDGYNLEVGEDGVVVPNHYNDNYIFLNEVDAKRFVDSCFATGHHNVHAEDLGFLDFDYDDYLDDYNEEWAA